MLDVPVALSFAAADAANALALRHPTIQNGFRRCLGEPAARWMKKE
jgi:hypothetical protein